MKKLKHWFDNKMSLLFFGETLDAKWNRDRTKFEAELIENYRKRCGTAKLPFNLNKLSIKGVIDFKHDLTRDDFDVNRAIHDIEYGVYEMITNKFQTENDSFELRKYYAIRNNF